MNNKFGKIARKRQITQWIIVFILFCSIFFFLSHMKIRQINSEHPNLDIAMTGLVCLLLTFAVVGMLGGDIVKFSNLQYLYDSASVLKPDKVFIPSDVYHCKFVGMLGAGKPLLSLCPLALDSTSLKASWNEESRRVFAFEQEMIEQELFSACHDESHSLKQKIIDGVVVVIGWEGNGKPFVTLHTVSDQIIEASKGECNA